MQVQVRSKCLCWWCWCCAKLMVYGPVWWSSQIWHPEVDGWRRQAGRQADQSSSAPAENQWGCFGDCGSEGWRFRMPKKFHRLEAWQAAETARPGPLKAGRKEG